ncbi:MAG TPA: acetate--CoA ligase family protein [Candidatus Deferrimicrobiaceae bacterium]|nr:acetate--CoA ligase family protein [Candidatus Deferrimicrobiaceae bacterium]
MISSLTPLFRPGRIAVIGASSNPEKMGFQIFRNILEAGFSGDVLPVNPKGEVILGRSSVRSAGEIPEGTDLAVVIIPAKLVPATILQLGERKVRSAIVITGGFAEAGEEGAALQDDLVRNAHRCGIRLIGPNCQGVNYPYHGLCASWPLITRRGEIAIVSQSGTVGAAFSDWASEDRLGFSAFVSMGNRADVDEADLIDFFADDPNTLVIALYIEGVKDAGKFLAALRKCRKPVVIFKAGRTERGRKAAESHTRSLAGKDEIYDAVFRQYGVHRASTLEELYDFSKALAYLPPPPGPRTLIVTSSGGSAIIATDVAEEEGFRVAALPPDLAGRLKEILPAHCIVGNPLDLTGDTDADRYRKVLSAAEGHYDVVMTIFGDPIAGAADVVRPGRCDLVAYLGGADVEREERGKMHEKKIAVFPTPERAVKALSCYARFDRKTFAPERSGAAPPGKTQGPVRAMTPAESMAFLAGNGFPVTDARAVTSEQEAIDAARLIGFPVVLKMNSPDVTHKSDVGGVILNIAGEEGVREAYRSIREAAGRIGATDGGALVAAMAPPGQEIIIGVTRDLQFGHAVMFGLGGIMVEVMKDVSFRIVPLTGKDAAEMVAEIRGARVLEGIRGKKPSDVQAVCDLLLRVSDLVARHPGIEEMDLNPVIVHEKGLTVADSRVVVSGTQK